MNNIDIKRKKVKAIYYNSFYCPECNCELINSEVLASYPPQYVYYCLDCGYRTFSSQQPGFEYEFEEDEDV